MLYAGDGGSPSSSHAYAIAAAVAATSYDDFAFALMNDPAPIFVSTGSGRGVFSMIIAAPRIPGFKFYEALQRLDKDGIVLLRLQDSRLKELRRRIGGGSL